MLDKEPSLFDHILLYASLILTWVGGEAGKVLVAGGLGGIFRWMMVNKRTIRDGGVAVITGMIAAKYMSPIVLIMIEKLLGDLGDGDDVVRTVAFAAGVGGMSIAKVSLAVIESRSNSTKEEQ